MTKLDRCLRLEHLQPVTDVVRRGQAHKRGEIVSAPGRKTRADLESDGVSGSYLVRCLPAAALADLRTGDAVRIVSTEGMATGRVTAVTALAAADPNVGSFAGWRRVILSPGSLDAPVSEAACWNGVSRSRDARF